MVKRVKKMSVPRDSGENETNEMMRETIFEAIRIQVRTNDPPETAMTLERLRAQGLSEEEAMKLVGCALSVEIFEIMTKGRTFDPDRYRTNLERLPELPF
ncbi:MAG: hypothetical protein M1313_11135 [Nitrospirae bacterium]|nr:hypothetical protein [Nitrospirota bacterium]